MRAHGPSPSHGKAPTAHPGAMMPTESNFPKYLPEGSGHQAPLCKLGCHCRAQTIDLPENKINSPSHSKYWKGGEEEEEINQASPAAQLKRD